jgi:hypothetical protein
MLNLLLSKSVDLQNPADVQANQQGQITSEQSSRLMASVGFQGGCAVLVASFIAFQFLFITIFFVGISWGEIAVVLAIVVFLAALGLIFRFGAWPLWQRWSALKRDRENRAIRIGQGQLAFQKDKYIAEAAGRDLQLPSSANAGGLKPGATYRFYYLEESGFVLSAEEVYPASPAQARSSLLGILASANNFQMDELEMNRNGEMTSAQRMKALPSMLFGLLIGAFPVGIGLAFFFLGREEDGDLLALLIPALFVLVFGLFGGYMFLNGLLDLMTHAPLVTEGAGHKEKRTSGGKNRSTTYYYVVDGVSFRVSRGAFLALVDGEHYRVYALPRTKRLLTIEPL